MRNERLAIRVPARVGKIGHRRSCIGASEQDAALLEHFAGCCDHDTARIIFGDTQKLSPVLRAGTAPGQIGVRIAFVHATAREHHRIGQEVHRVHTTQHEHFDVLVVREIGREHAIVDTIFRLTRLGITHEHDRCSQLGRGWIRNGIIDVVADRGKHLLIRNRFDGSVRHINTHRNSSRCNLFAPIISTRARAKGYRAITDTHTWMCKAT